MILRPSQIKLYTPSLLAFVSISGCTAAPSPVDHALYSEALTASQSRLRLPGSVVLHPLLALWPDDGPIDAPLTGFNAYDTVSVPGIVEARPDAYALCDVGATGMCQVAPGDVAIVLSPLRDLGPTNRALRLVVYDGRPGSDNYRDYLVRLKRRWLGGWVLASLTRLE